MYKYHCLNPIAKVGLDRFTPDYTKTNEITEADGILVRSASMHELELPAGLLAVGGNLYVCDSFNQAVYVIAL